MFISGNRRRLLGPFFDVDEAELGEQIEIGRHRDRNADEAHQAEGPEWVLAEEVGNIWDKVEHALHNTRAMQKSRQSFHSNFSQSPVEKDVGPTDVLNG